MQYSFALQTVIDRIAYKNAQLKIRRNNINLYDDVFGIGHKFESFYDISSASVQRAIKTESDNLFEIVIQLDQNKIEHKREVYTLINLLKEAGGILLAIKFIPGLFLLPIAHHKCLMQASQELFLFNQDNAEIFRSSLDHDKHKELKGNQYRISYSLLSSLQIFLIGQYRCFSRCFKNGKKKLKIM